MNYELAIELKEAGFPQTIEVGDKYYGYPISITRLSINDDAPITIHLGSVEDYDHQKDVVAKIPSLSELIEACVKDMRNDFHLVNWGTEWICGDYDGYLQDWVTHRCSGSTPEEAVARLYLALNKHDKN